MQRRTAVVVKNQNSTTHFPAANNAIVAQLLPAAEINWSPPNGKPVSTNGTLGKLLDLMRYEPSACCVRNKYLIPFWKAASAASRPE